MKEILVNFTNVVGSIKPLHGIGNAPLLLNSDEQLFSYLHEAGIPFSRLHDTGGRYGGGCFVDVPNVFPDFSADPNDPSSYDFAFTDWLMAALIKQGVKPFYRLGVTIENDNNIKTYHIYPPTDFLKWAKICAGIIRHYTEGWADGFSYPIEYWEIWNEPDNWDVLEKNNMWKGTPEEFFEMYAIAATYLKLEFPHLKIGGYSSCGFYAIHGTDQSDTAHSSSRVEYFLNFFHDFLKYITSLDHPVPLDFFSWHSYDGMKENKGSAKYVREQLDAYGFKHTESILNEWNPGIEYRGTAQDSANIAEMLCNMQQTSVDKMMYYDGQVYTPYGGLFNSMTLEPTKALYALKSFNELYKLGQEVELKINGEYISACAATDGNRNTLMIVNSGNEYNEILLKVFPELKFSECILTDECNTYSYSPSIKTEDGTINVPPRSIVLFKFKG